MPIIREFRCLDCETIFESSDQDPSCPTCTSEVERVFLTPPNIKSPQTSFKDQTVKELAADFGMSDMSNKHGQAIKTQGPIGPAPQFAGGAENVNSLLGRLNSNNRDGFSGVLPALRNAGGPRNWAKVKAR